MIKNITVRELKNMIENKENFKLIDVREPHEIEIATIGGKLIPLNTVPSALEQFDANIPKIIVYCRSGKRSANVIQFVQETTQQTNLYNLEGGILEWANEIDPSITKY